MCVVGENKCFHGQEVVPDFQENITNLLTCTITQNVASLCCNSQSRSFSAQSLKSINFFVSRGWVGGGGS